MTPFTLTPPPFRIRTPGRRTGCSQLPGVVLWDDLPGRGIPEIVDFDLVRDAERAVAAQGPAPSGVGLEALTFPKARSAAGSDAGSTVSWDASSAASNASTKKLEDMMASMHGALGAQMQTLAAEVNGIKKGHGEYGSGR